MVLRYFCATTSCKTPNHFQLRRTILSIDHLFLLKCLAFPFIASSLQAVQIVAKVGSLTLEALI